jgi:hypothetical protein
VSREETTERSLLHCAHTEERPCEDSENGAVCKTGELSLETKVAGNLIMDF